MSTSASTASVYVDLNNSFVSGNSNYYLESPVLFVTHSPEPKKEKKMSKWLEKQIRRRGWR